ncbi:50S ribosomal protein L31 [Patescibacteria group bacterium]|nr:50S ribosomal protein L31 [Patescibacteria group bacterium]
MKTGIHPAYHQITVSCACGHSFTVGSTHAEDMRVEVCANCHPLYTGKANLVDTAGRLDKFNARQQKAQAHKEAAKVRLESKKAKAAEAEAAAKQAETSK